MLYFGIWRSILKVALSGWTPPANFLLQGLPRYSVPMIQRSCTELLHVFWFNLSRSYQAASTALERLQVSLVFDIDTAHELLDDISATIDVGAPCPLKLLLIWSLLQSDYSGENQLRCLVVDTITPLLGPLLSAVSAQGHAIMSGLMRQLKDLAKRRNLSIFVRTPSSSVHSFR